ncbi:MAG: serine/threonine protein kinase [Cytophagaceae bacterium]|nr:serine/threonine protein kinase [Gemmatimonadaceae bacterium]
MPTAPEVQTLTQLLGGQYRVEEEIGRGGMGVVVRAHDLRLDRAVAIKTLPAHLAGDAIIRERFLREARTAASLSHPNIVPIHSADEVDDVVFFVMGLVAGLSVAQRVRSTGLFAPVETIAILSDVAAALGYAHACGVIHRDVKAENILLDARNGRAMVTDFGIARLAEAAPITATGTVLGTVHYMSPEQISGHAIDGRSDLYSLGVLAFHMLSGRFPFEHDAPSAVLVAHVMSHAPALHTVAPQVPAPLAAVVDRLLKRDPLGRYETAAHVTVALREALSQLDPDAAAVQPVLSSTEANQVWERAALLQQMTGQHVPPPAPRPRAPTPPSSTRGYRLDDVREAAEQAGISSRYVERALAERSGVPGDAIQVRPGPMMNEPVSRWMGSPTRLEYEAIIDGELSDDELEEVVDEMRRSIGEFGSVGTVGRTITFTSHNSVPAGSYPRKLQVSVSSRGGRTSLRAYEDLRQVAQGVIWGITGGVGGGGGGMAFGIIMAATKGAAIAVAPFAFAGVAAASWLGSRLILRAMVRSKEREIMTSMERVAARIRELLDARRPALGSGEDRKKRLR